MVFPMKFYHLDFEAATHPKYDFISPAMMSECLFNDFNIDSRLLCTIIIAQIGKYCWFNIAWSRNFTVNAMPINLLSQTLL
jgi:hypothetical protein